MKLTDQVCKLVRIAHLRHYSAWPLTAVNIKEPSLASSPLDHFHQTLDMLIINRLYRLH